MCSLFRRFLCAMALSVGMVPLLVAQPQVLSPDQSAVTVGAADTISFSNGDITSVGSQFTLIAPDGTSMSIVRNIGAAGTPQDQVTISLGGAGVANAANWQATGSLNGLPADGSWQLRYVGIATHSGQFGTPTVVLNVAGRTLDVSVGASSPDTTYTMWNWHKGSSTYRQWRALTATSLSRPVEF